MVHRTPILYHTQYLEMGELIMLRLEDRILETLLREVLDGVVTKGK